MAKQNFLGLVKFTGTYADYQKQQVNGKLVFANVTGDTNAGKYIWANGLEYKVADSTNLDDLIQRVRSLETSMSTLEAWKSVVNSSIADLDTSVENHEGRIDTLESTAEALDKRIADVSQDVINISTYVHETVDASISNISTRLSNVGIAAADNKLSVNGKDVTLSGSDYVTVTAADNSVNVSLNAQKIQDGGSAEGHEKLATKGYVDEQMGELTQALVFKGSVSDELPLPTEGQKVGDTYVASKAMTNPKADAGDLFIWNGSNWTQVERNLDGAVQADVALGADYVILGNGNQNIKASTLSISELNTAIANANSALQNVTASTLSEFVTVTAVKDANVVNVSVGVTTHDVSTATSDANGLATALGVKEYVDAQAADIKVQATLNSSTTDYVEASAFVDPTGRVISASVGVKTATLANASNGSTGLAMAEDVYNELTAVEQTMATANTTMSNTIGLNSDYSVTWSTASGIAPDTTIVKAIEDVAKKADEAKQSGVTEFDGKTGAISIDTTNTTDGSIKFAMDGSTLKGSVNGWSGLVDRVAAAETSIDNVSTRVNEVSTRLDDLSTYVRKTVDASIDALQAKDVEIDSSIDALQAKDVEIDASIDRLDASVSALESRTITGESSTLTNANDEYVNVSATTDDQGNVTIDSSVQLANPIEGETHADATGLATDGWVKDFLAWDVIG